MQVFTTEEVAKYLNCSKSSIRKLVKNGEIPSFRLGSKLNFNKESIDCWIRNEELKSLKEDDFNNIQIKSIKGEI